MVPTYIIPVIVHIISRYVNQCEYSQDVSTIPGSIWFHSLFWTASCGELYGRQPLASEPLMKSSCGQFHATSMATRFPTIAQGQGCVHVQIRQWQRRQCRPTVIATEGNWRQQKRLRCELLKFNPTKQGGDKKTKERPGWSQLKATENLCNAKFWSVQHIKAGAEGVGTMMTTTPARISWF